jgi:hypothetical protein
MNDPLYAADAYSFERTDPANDAKTGAEYVPSITCIPASRNQHSDDASGVTTAPCSECTLRPQDSGIALTTSHPSTSTDLNSMHYAYVPSQ